MTNHATGHLAEKIAARSLRKEGFRIKALNWKTTRCEIDIVANKQNVMYFCEVKYRKNNQQGEGLEYVTPTKLKQMIYAAESWVAAHAWEGDYRLLVVSMSADTMDVIEVA